MGRLRLDAQRRHDPGPGEGLQLVVVHALQGRAPVTWSADQLVTQGTSIPTCSFDTGAGLTRRLGSGLAMESPKEPGSASPPMVERLGERAGRAAPGG